MVQRVVRLIVMIAVMSLAACTVTPGDMSVPMEMPPGDPLKDSAAESLWQMAVAAREQNNLAAAGRYLERALYMQPESSWLYRELAELRLREDDPQSAEVMIQRALRLAPPRPAYQAALWQLLATARMRQGDEQGAERARLEAEMLVRRR
ncbi:tetratricopeptide repeat protein [Alcanivorax sp. 1008]|uniref:tetratricopeptide repeat protein n=1 Tax=Alcanivorax sp. 1008 TaxID=2816853 RepID=UPI001D8CFE1E|nr:tetratricopeptide repeat protein [Alcanivorax sp. 1008]MCC1497875.1 tetratricopeptide repeat protein [Alcanivorax sp. 1008]